MPFDAMTWPPSHLSSPERPSILSPASAGDMAIGKRVGFIGSGQMAEALARGLMEKGMITGDMISCSDPTPARKELFKSFGGWGACTPRSQGNEGAWGRGRCRGMQPCTPCTPCSHTLHELHAGRERGSLRCRGFQTCMQEWLHTGRGTQGGAGPAGSFLHTCMANPCLPARRSPLMHVCMQAPTLTNPTLT